MKWIVGVFSLLYFILSILPFIAKLKGYIHTYIINALSLYIVMLNFYGYIAEMFLIKFNIETVKYSGSNIIKSTPTGLQ